jgi:hypothetical protein
VATVVDILTRLRADPSGLIAGMKEAQAQSEQTVRAINTGFKEIGEGAAAAGAKSKIFATAIGFAGGSLLTTGIMSVGRALKGAIADAGDYNRLQAQSAAVVKSTGSAAGVTASQMAEMAHHLQGVSTASEATIQNGENIMATFTNVRNVAGAGNDIFDQSTTAMLNLSTAMGQDTKTSAIQLGKALNNPLTGMKALQRVGVTFSDQQKAQIKTMMAAGNQMGAQKIILKELGTEFGGSALAQGNTFAGMMIHIKESIRDALRNGFTAIQPTLITIGHAIGEVMHILAPFGKWFGNNVGAIVQFALVIGALVAAIKIYEGVVKAVKLVQEAWTIATLMMDGVKAADIAVTEGMTGAWVALNAVMEMNPILLIVAAAVLLVAGFVILWKHSKSFRDLVIDIGQVGVKVFGAIIWAVGQLVVGIMKLVTTPMRLLLKGLAFLGVSGAKTALADINAGIKDVGNFFNDAAAKVENFAKGMDKLKKSAPKASDKSSLPHRVMAPGNHGGGKLTQAQIDALAKLKQAMQDEKQTVVDFANYMRGDFIASIKDGTTKGATIVTALAGNMDKVIKGFAATMSSSSAASAFTLGATKISQGVQATLTALGKQLDVVNTQRAEIQKKIDNETKIHDNLVQARSAYVTSMADSLSKANNSLADFVTTTGLISSPKAMIENFQRRLKVMKEFAANVKALTAKGLNQSIIDEVIAMGSGNGGALAKSLMTATAEQIKDLNSATADITSTATEMSNVVGDKFLKGGIDASQAIIDGLMSQQDKLIAAADLIGQKMAQAISAAMAQLNLLGNTKTFSPVVTASDDAGDKLAKDAAAALAAAKALDGAKKTLLPAVKEIAKVVAAIPTRLPDWANTSSPSGIADAYRFLPAPAPNPIARYLPNSGSSIGAGAGQIPSQVLNLTINSPTTDPKALAQHAIDQAQAAFAAMANRAMADRRTN